MLELFCAQRKARNDFTDYSLGCPLIKLIVAKSAFNEFRSQVQPQPDIYSLIDNNHVMKILIALIL